jgi:broad specificity phosphatase PhoE
MDRAMTVLHLVRHAETVWHAENRYAGISDIALTSEGVAQATRLGHWASTAGLDAIYCSTLGRAVTTAAPAAAATGLVVQQEAALIEVDFGEGEGLTRTEMRSKFPEALEQFLERPAENPLPGGERGLDAIARARPALERIATEHPDGTVLVVMHSTLVRLMICAFAGIEPNDYRRVLPHIHNVALNTIRLKDGTAALLGLNVPVACSE